MSDCCWFEAIHVPWTLPPTLNPLPLPQAVCNIFSLILEISSITLLCLGVPLLIFDLLGLWSAFWICKLISFFSFGKFSPISFHMLLLPRVFFLYFWDLIECQMLHVIHCRISEPCHLSPERFRFISCRSAGMGADNLNLAKERTNSGLFCNFVRLDISLIFYYS